jgi:hypothetical protein
MTRSTAFAPASPSGGISSIIGATWANDAEFLAKIKHEQAQVNMWRADPTGPDLIINHAASVASGPLGLLTVIHPMGGGRPEVTVFHALRAYMANPLEMNPVDANLRDKVYAFSGEIYVDEGLVTLPSVFVQPENLEAILSKQVVKVPTEAALVEAWETYDAAATGDPNMGELMSARLLSENIELPHVIVIPSLFIPLLIDRPTPREAWKKMKAVMEEVAEADRPIFESLMRYLRASCVKNGTRGAVGEVSLMTTTWAAPPSNEERAQS